MSAYAPHPRGVEKTGVDGPIVLNIDQAHQLLDLWLCTGARADYWALHDAAEQHPDFIPRAHAWRRVAA